jgi:hypothetical protein
MKQIINFAVHFLLITTMAFISCSKNNPPGNISVSNIIYVAGGYVNGVLSNQVWKLEF